MALACLGRDRELGGIVQPGIKEIAFAMHLQNGHEGIPVRYRSPSGPRVEVYPSKAKRRRNQDGSAFAIRTKSFAVQGQFDVEPSRPPTV